MPRPQFIVLTGDCTEFGSQAHYALFRKLESDLQVPVLAVPGNHDTTWAPKSRWEENLGPRHFSVQCGNLQVIGLDSTLEMRGEGHIDAAERDWLVRTLDGLPRGRSVILGWHQPLTGGKSLDYSTEAFITGILCRYPVIATLTGHNHADSLQIVEQVPCFVSAATWGNGTACANIITVTDTEAVFEKLRFGSGERKTFATLPLQAPNHGVLPRFIAPAGQTVSGGAEVIIQASDDYQSGQCRFGGEDFVSLRRDGGNLRATLPAPPVPGNYKIIAALKSGKSTHWMWRDVTVADPAHRQAWRFPSGSEIRCKPLCADGKVIFGNYGGRVYGLDARTGQPVWLSLVHGAVRGPVARLGEAAALATTEGHVCLLRIGDGETVADIPVGAPVLTGVAVADARLYVGTTAGEVVCLQNQRVLWRAQTGYLLDAAPLISRGVVYAANWHNAVVALDATTGRELWRSKIGSNEYYSPAAATPAILGESLFLVSPDEKMYCLDAKTGAIRQTLPADCYAALAGGPDAVYVRSLQSKLDAYNEAAKRLWSAQALWGWDHSPSSPVVADDTIYAAGKYGTLEAFRSADGAKQWGYRIAADKVFSSPACDDERVYCGTLDGDVVALGR